jgi:hypothetical protein
MTALQFWAHRQREAKLKPNTGFRRNNGCFAVSAMSKEKKLTDPEEVKKLRPKPDALSTIIDRFAHEVEEVEEVIVDPDQPSKPKASQD